MTGWAIFDFISNQLRESDLFFKLRWGLISFGWSLLVRLECDVNELMDTRFIFKSSNWWTSSFMSSLLASPEYSGTKNYSSIIWNGIFCVIIFRPLPLGWLRKPENPLRPFSLFPSDSSAQRQRWHTQPATIGMSISPKKNQFPLVAHTVRTKRKLYYS